MKATNVLFLLLLSFGFNHSAQGQSKSTPIIDGIAIVINNDVITFSEWRQAVAQARGQYVSSGRTLDAAAREDIVNVIVLERLKSQLAQRNGIKISDEEVDSAIEDIARNNKATVAMLKQYLASTGQSFDSFRENIRRQISSARIRDSVMQSVNISDTELDLYMHSAEFKNVLVQLQKSEIKQTKALHILVRISKDLSDQAANARIKRLRERIIGGESFDEIARAQSDDPGSAAKGGDLGWTTKGQLTPEFDTAMDRLALNVLSEVVKTPFGYHLIKVTERRNGAQTQEMVRSTAREMLFRKKATQKWAIWQESLLAQAYIETRF
ncbi:chaperone SurA [Gammaproteobacteria bacterium]|nr:chaperone SurA [Gammaproteobacteria bacterium]